ncbi:MAG: hypothetical protein KAU17_02470, partial [Spirochaetales bacterium]|nr:hypothetical protein [Spirochaetales bacterium]
MKYGSGGEGIVFVGASNLDFIVEHACGKANLSCRFNFLVLVYRGLNMAIPIKKTDGKYNYADYLLWPDDERWELIEGIPYSMSPAPSRIHQEI